MRLFIALNLPKRERVRVHSSAQRFRDEELPVRWIDETKLHITLKFLGQVRAGRLDEIQEVMERVAESTPAFDIELGGFGAFPTIRRPRVIWLGVDASPELRCLKQDLEWALGDCGFDPETRAFHPHITLGRADGEGGAGAFRGLDEMVREMDFQGTVAVKSVDLMRSRLSKDGARYERLFDARLTTA